MDMKDIMKDLVWIRVLARHGRGALVVCLVVVVSTRKQ